ncbi:MAG: hypothetical protein LUG60_06945 [Erysipelotrichaceae bacterium]|nr:hypothetical protein [Erysipelotrichaceae bacterium]
MTEIIATSAVKMAISKSEFLVPNINENDKVPILDGTVEVYRTKSRYNHKNEDRYGVAHVQVKSISLERLERFKTTYRVKLLDLKSYRDVGGIILFVVSIDEEKNTKIYYAKLLPYDINTYLSTCRNKKTKSVKLFPFPTSVEEISDLFINFVKDSKIQSNIKNDVLPTIQDLTRQFGNGIKYKISFMNTTPNNVDNYLLTHDLYLYVEINSDLELSYPVNHIDKFESIERVINENIQVDGKIYYTNYKTINKLDEKKVIFGKCFFIEKLNNNVNIKFKLNGSLHNRINALEFLLNINSSKKFFIGTQELFLKSEELLKNDDLNKIESHLKYLKDLKYTLNQLDVKTELNMDLVSLKDYKTLTAMINGIKYHTFVKPDQKIDNVIQLSSTNIANITVCYILEKRDNLYEISNFNDHKGHFACSYDGENFSESSLFNLLAKDDFLQLSNINYDKMVNSITSIHNEIHYIKTNFTLLDILLAYDINYNEKLLNVAIEISKWLYECWTNEKRIINLYQCYIRERPLYENEKNEIIELLESTKDNLTIIGCYILLGYKDMIEYYKNKLTQLELEVLQSYPIYNLID